MLSCRMPSARCSERCGPWVWPVPVHTLRGIMPWTPDHYPAAMRRLPVLVRLKAIQIANALLAEGWDEGRAIRSGISRAKAWVAEHASPLAPGRH